MILQWGKVTNIANNAWRKVTFPVTFSSLNIIVTGTDTYSNINFIAIASSTTAGFQISNKSNASSSSYDVHGHWLAIGY